MSNPDFRSVSNSNPCEQRRKTIVDSYKEAGTTPYTSVSNSKMRRDSSVLSGSGGNKRRMSELFRKKPPTQQAQIPAPPKDHAHTEGAHAINRLDQTTVVSTSHPTFASPAPSTSSAPITTPTPIAAPTPISSSFLPSSHANPMILSPSSNGSKFVSTTDLQQSLHRGEENLDRLLNQRIAQEELNEQGVTILNDVRQLLRDFSAFLAVKNSDEKFQKLAMHASALASDLRADPDLRELVSHWRSIVIGAGGHGGIGRGFMRSGGLLMRELRDTECLVRLIIESEKLLEFAFKNHELDTPNPEKEAQKDRVFQQLLAVLRVLGRNPGWQQIVLQFKDFQSDTMSRHRPGIEVEVGRRKAEEIKDSEQYKKSVADFMHIIRSLMIRPDAADPDRAASLLHAAFDEVRQHEMYRTYMNEVWDAVASVVEDPSIMDSTSTRMHLRELYDQGWRLVEEVKNRDTVQQARREVNNVWDAIAQDEHNARIINHTRTMFHHMRPADKNSEHLIDYGVFKQFQHLLVPFLLESFRSIPMPPSSGITPDRSMRFHVENVILSSLEILPENIHIEVSYKADTDPYRLTMHETDMILWIEASRIRGRIQDCSWSFSRLKFPRLKDAGHANAVLGGTGARVGIKLRIQKEQQVKEGSSRAGRVTQVLDSYCYIDHLDLTLFGCKHRTLYRLLHAHISKRIGAVLEEAIASKLQSTIEVWDRKLGGQLMSAREKQQLVKTRLASIKKKNGKIETKTEVIQSQDEVNAGGDVTNTTTDTITTTITPAPVLTTDAATEDPVSPPTMSPVASPMGIQVDEQGNRVETQKSHLVMQPYATVPSVASGLPPLRV
eukprot:TRINITY_DN3452_c0_g1_i3.p1 TRINITY_DN3452_c0_g1~~TRINITY_DN3452_c0_g1_i3.p1  ORF type:complete len:884 (-),score=292.35 TRINITY_DN3452_c0_g1_i3:53-2560(-)